MAFVLQWSQPGSAVRLKKTLPTWGGTDRGTIPLHLFFFFFFFFVPRPWNRKGHVPFFFWWALGCIALFLVSRLCPTWEPWLLDVAGKFFTWSEKKEAPLWPQPQFSPSSTLTSFTRDKVGLWSPSDACAHFTLCSEWSSPTSSWIWNKAEVSLLPTSPTSHTRPLFSGG